MQKIDAMIPNEGNDGVKNTLFAMGKVWKSESLFLAQLVSQHIF